MADEDGNGSSNGGNVGTVEQITGVVVDALFPDELPEIYSALEIKRPGSDEDDSSVIVCEVQQHLGDDRVRTVAMDATDGLSRGDEVVDTGSPITVPVGKDTLGRIFNLLGETIDEGDPVEGEERWPIHRPGAHGRAAGADPGDPRDRDQGRRPARRPTRRAARSASSAAPESARRC